MTRTIENLSKLFLFGLFALVAAQATAGGYKHQKASSNDIVDTVVSAGQFETLAAALDAAASCT